MENMVYKPTKTSTAGDPPIGTRPGPARRAASDQVSGRRAGRPSLFGRALSGRAALAAVAATAVGAGALGAVASSASAATPKWGYEQISPATSSSIDIFGTRVSEDMSTVVAKTQTVPLPGMPADGRIIFYDYVLPRGGAPWALGPVDYRNGQQGAAVVPELSTDGTRALYVGPFPSVMGDPTGQAYRVDAQGGAVNMSGLGDSLNVGVVAASANLDAVAFLHGTTDPPAFLGRGGQAPVQVSIDDDGASMSATALGGGTQTLGGTALFRTNAVSRDGSSVIFSSTQAVSGDNDGAGLDLFRRIVTPGAERTILISDATPNDDPETSTAGAEYQWATGDHQRVFFVTEDALDAADTDGEPDIYMREGTGGSVRVSQGESVDGSPTGNAAGTEETGEMRPHWVMSSDDGNRTFFVAQERLTQDAPAAGMKLYERDVAEGRTRFVAGPLPPADYNRNASADRGSLLTEVQPSLHHRGLRPTPDGAVFMAEAPLAGAEGGEERPSIFSWTRDGGLVHINKPDADAPPSAPAAASFVARNLGSSPWDTATMQGGRGASDDGSRVFFTTSQSLVAEDTDGDHSDVYAWTVGEGLSLVTPPGRGKFDAGYLDSSPDGTEVYFGTNEGILAGDTDPDAQDVYLAILGGGSPISRPAPDADPDVCTGEACQGPVGGPVGAPAIGSVGLGGAGNLLTKPAAGRASVSVGKVKAVRGTAVTLRVRVSGAGRVSVSGASLRRASKSAPKAGSYAVRVGLSSAAKRSLRKKGTLKVRVRVAYRATGGGTASKSVSVSFKQPKVSSTKGGR